MNDRLAWPEKGFEKILHKALEKGQATAKFASNREAILFRLSLQKFLIEVGAKDDLPKGKIFRTIVKNTLATLKIISEVEVDIL